MTTSPGVATHPAAQTLPVADLLQVLLIIVVWGVNFVVIKWGVADVPPLLLGAIRFTLASLPMLLFVRRPQLPWRWLAAYGLTVGVGQFGLLFTAIKLGMPAGLASVVLQSQAFITLLIAALWLGERCQPVQWAGLLCALCGLALIGVGKGGAMALTGFLLTIGAATCWATSNVVIRAIGRAGYQPQPMGLVVWSSLIPPLPFLLLSLTFDGPAQIIYTLTHLTGTAIFASGYLAFVGTLLGYGLWSRLLTRHPAGKVAPFSLLIPVVGLLTAWLVLDERLNVWQAVGSAVLMAGLLVNVFGQRWLKKTSSEIY